MDRGKTGTTPSQRLLSWCLDINVHSGERMTFWCIHKTRKVYQDSSIIV